MVTVGLDGERVESALASGELRCPECGGVLRPWGWARQRALRGEHDQRVVLRPRRSRCRMCGLSHVLLPGFALARRADLVEVIGRALTAVAAGAGARRAAAQIGRSMETVRGWLRRFRARAERLRVLFTALLVEVAPDPVPPSAASNPVADAVAAIVGAAWAARSRWRSRWPESVEESLSDFLSEVPVWRFAAGVSHGQLLAPDWPSNRSGAVSSARN